MLDDKQLNEFEAQCMRLRPSAPRDNILALIAEVRELQNIVIYLMDELDELKAASK